MQLWRTCGGWKCARPAAQAHAMHAIPSTICQNLDARHKRMSQYRDRGSTKKWTRFERVYLGTANLRTAAAVCPERKNIVPSSAARNVDASMCRPETPHASHAGLRVQHSTTLSFVEFSDEVYAMASEAFQLQPKGPGLAIAS
jgi:hypothetical protein